MAAARSRGPGAPAPPPPGSAPGCVPGRAWLSGPGKGSRKQARSRVRSAACRPGEPWNLLGARTPRGCLCAPRWSPFSRSCHFSSGTFAWHMFAAHGGGGGGGRQVRPPEETSPDWGWALRNFELSGASRNLLPQLQCAQVGCIGCAPIRAPLLGINFLAPLGSRRVPSPLDKLTVAIMLGEPKTSLPALLLLKVKFSRILYDSAFAV